MSSGIGHAVRGATIAGTVIGGAAVAATAARRLREPRVVTGQVMSTPPVTIDGDSTVSDAAALLASTGAGALPVCDGNGGPMGLVTDRDLVVRVLAQDGEAPDRPVREVADSPPVVAGPTEPITSAAAKMRDRNLRRLPVVAHGRVIGIVSRGDLIRHLPARAARELHRLDPAEHTDDRRSGRWAFERAYR